MNYPEKKGYFYLAIGVFKVDYKCAGYPDVRKVAEEWKEQKGFYSLFIRKVSKDNYGIQFVYLSKDPDAPKISMFRHDLERRFGIGLYAVDYQETEEHMPLEEKIQDWLILEKSILS